MTATLLRGLNLFNRILVFPAKFLERKQSNEKILRIKKSIFLLGLLILVSNSSIAQITAGFELDGDVIATGANPPDDWDLIYNGTSSAQVTTGIVVDTDSTFQGGGSKDDLDVPNWGWDTSSVPDKDDILHGGVALYNNCQLYFFADRYATNGSSNIGFWLFKNNISLNSISWAIRSEWRCVYAR